MPDQLSTDDLRRLRDFRARIGYADPPIGYPTGDPDDDWDATGAHLQDESTTRARRFGLAVLGILGGAAVLIGFWLLLQIFSWARAYWGAP